MARTHLKNRKRMITIDGDRSKASELPDFSARADLVFFDGPLISLCRSEDGQEFLTVWIDCDDRRNRWAAVDVDRETLDDYINQKVTLLNVFERSSSIWTFDISGRRRSNLTRTALAAFPAAYLPLEQSYLTPDICTEEARQLAEADAELYEIKLDGEIYLEDLARIPKLYQQLYVFIYGLKNLGRESVRTAMERIAHDWKGGISAVNLFSGLQSVIPSFHRPKIVRLEYASPGKIEIDLLADIADSIKLSLSGLGENSEVAEALYREIYKYFRDEKMSGFDEGSRKKADLLTSEQVAQLSQYSSNLEQILCVSDLTDEIESLNLDPLSRLRALLAFYRRLRGFSAYERRGLVRLT